MAKKKNRNPDVQMFLNPKDIIQTFFMVAMDILII